MWSARSCARLLLPALLLCAAARALAQPVLSASPALIAATPYDQEAQDLHARYQRDAARRAPGAIIPVLQLAGLHEQVVDRAALLRSIAALPALAQRQPLVRAHALWLQREALRWQGQAEQSDALTRELGLVPATAVSILGPFDNEGQRGHAQAYPPEEEQVAPGAEQSYPGKSRGAPLRWRALTEAAAHRDGVLPLGALQRPEEWATTYVATYVKNPGVAPLPVAVRVGASGALKVFVNRGKPILDRDLYRVLRLDQEAAAAVLRPGWNRVLVKVSGSEEPAALLLRLTTPDGAPLTGLSFSQAPPQAAWSLPTALPPATAPATLLDGLRRALAALPAPRAAAGVRAAAPLSEAAAAARAEALTDLGLYLHHFVPGDPADREDELLLREALTLRKSARAYRLLAEVCEDADRRRQVLREAALWLQAQPAPTEGRGDAVVERARLLLLEGQMSEESHRDRLAEASYREAAALVPTLYSATLALATLHASRGLPALALRLLDGLPAPLRPAAAPAVPLRVLRAMASFTSALGRVTQADAIYAMILQARAADSEGLRHQIERHRARGELQEALRALDLLARGRPEQAFLRRERIEMLEGAGQLGAALAATGAALELVPLDPDLWQLRARLLQRSGKDLLALAAYRQALILRPQSPELRAYLQRLDPQARSGEDLTRRFRVDAATLARPPVDPRSKDPARVLLDQAVTRVHLNGLSEVFTQRVLEILDERGAREHGSLDIRYTPDTQSVQIKAARVLRRGTVREAVNQSERDVSEPWYGLYYDVRALALRFDGLEPGDVIDVQYVVADVGRRNLLADYFGDVHYFQEDIPRLTSRYLLLWPEPTERSRPLYVNLGPVGGGIAAPKIERSEQVEPGVGGEPPLRLYRFEARDVPRLVSEPGMPGFSEVAPFLHVSTFRDWGEVATFYQGLVAEQLAVPPEVRAAARAQVVGISDEKQRLRAIYDFVVKKTRYVGLEFGIHGFKPYKIAQIFARKFGDCKDKAALLHVMLREVGIESSMVLARTRRMGSLPAEPASLAAFDHAIVFVPKFDLYLDGTAEFSGADELPEQDQDIPVLIVSDPRPPFLGKGHLARTPVLPAAMNTVARALHVTLRPDGSARVRDHMEVRGQVAQKWREHYQASGAQRERYEKSWTETAPGARALKVELPGIADLERPVVLQGELEAPQWGRSSPGGPGEDGRARGKGELGAGDLTVHPLGREPDLLRSFARLSQRRYDLILGFPWRNTEKVTLQLPAGFAARRLPEGRTLESRLGRFHMTVERRGAEITIAAELTLFSHRIASQDYPEFRRFCAEVDSIVGQDLVVGHE